MVKADFDGWREIIIPPSEEGKRVWLKPNFEIPVRKTKWRLAWYGEYPHFVKEQDNSSWKLIKEFFKGRLEKLLYRRSDCSQGSLENCYVVKAIKGDNTFMGHVVSMVLGQSIVAMSEEDEIIWLHDLASPRNFPYEVVKTRTGWSLKEDSNENVKLLYNSHYLMMIVKSGCSTNVYFYRTPCTN